MNYSSIRKFDVTNGVGIRTTLFVSGCTHKCKGCFNEEQQDFNYGEPFTKEIEDKFIEYANNPLIKGISILGGEPLQQGDDMYNLLKRLKEEVKKPIWLWTGYKYEYVKKSEMSKCLNYIDVLIDGKYEEEKRDLTLKYRGSSNQRVIEVNKYENEKK